MSWDLLCVESLYRKEYETFCNSNLCGEDWFENYTDGGKKILDFIYSLREECTFRDCSFLDLGCGNGQFLLLVDPTKFTKIVGVDYSFSAIELAKAYSEKLHSPVEWLQAIGCFPPTSSGKSWQLELYTR